MRNCGNKCFRLLVQYLIGNKGDMCTRLYSWYRQTVPFTSPYHSECTRPYTVGTDRKYIFCISVPLVHLSDSPQKCWTLNAGVRPSKALFFRCLMSTLHSKYFPFQCIIFFYQYTRLPVTRWVTNTTNDQFDRNAILTVYM